MFSLSEITLRKETKEDFSETENVTREAFWNKFMPGCDEHLFLHELRDKKSYLPDLSLIAVYNNKIIGAIIYLESQIEDEQGNKIKILSFGPLCVEPNYQKKGIGKLLIKTTIEKIKKDTNYPCIIIYGSSKYYPKFGFEPCSKYNIYPEDGNISDNFMCYELKNGFLKSIKKGLFILPKDIKFNFSKEEIDEFDKKFPFKEKKIQPGQFKSIK